MKVEINKENGKALIVRKIVLVLPLLVVAWMLTGCANCAIVYDEQCRKLMACTEEIPVGDRKYCLQKVDISKGELSVKDLLDLRGMFINAQNAIAVKRRLVDGSPQVFDPADTNAIQVQVKVLRREDATLAPVATINDILSICSLTVWPMYKNVDYTYEISVIFPDKTEKQTYKASERVLMSILPLGLIPVPALADDRMYFETKPLKHTKESDLIVKAVESVFRDKKMQDRPPASGVSK